jgi:hypothetical protein
MWLLSSGAWALSQSRVREFYSKGESIVARLLPGDEVVIVRQLAEVPLRSTSEPPPSMEAELRRLAVHHAVLEVEVIGAEPRFVRDESWLATDVTLRIHRTLSEKPEWCQRGQRGQEFSMTLDGGEVTVGHVLVKVGDYPMLRKGRVSAKVS